MNISQNEFARKCGLSSAFMSQLMTGERFAGPRARKKIMRAFKEADFDKLFEEVVRGVH